MYCENIYTQFFFEERTGAQENQMKFLKRSNYFFSTSFVHAESSSDVVQQVYMYMRNEKERKKTHFYWNAYHNGSSRQNSTLSGYLNSTSIHKILRIFFFYFVKSELLECVCVKCKYMYGPFSSLFDDVVFSMFVRVLLVHVNVNKFVRDTIELLVQCVQHTTAT